jgi:hypothetical protein
MRAGRSELVEQDRHALAAPIVGSSTTRHVGGVQCDGVDHAEVALSVLTS